MEPPDSVELMREFLPGGGVVPPDEDRPGVVAVSVCPSDDEQAVGERHDGVAAEGDRLRGRGVLERVWTGGEAGY